MFFPNITSIYIDDNFFHFMNHQSGYFVFTCVGLIGILESKSILPKDSVRLIASLANLSMYILFGVHSMEQYKVLAMAHVLLSYLFLGTSIVMIYSLVNKSSFVAAIGAYVMMMTTGLWFVTMAIIFYKPFFSLKSESRDILPDMGFLSSLFMIETIFFIMSLYIIGSIYYMRDLQKEVKEENAKEEILRLV